MGNLVRSFTPRPGTSLKALSNSSHPLKKLFRFEPEALQAFEAAIESNTVSGSGVDKHSSHRTYEKHYTEQRHSGWGGGEERRGGKGWDTRKCNRQFEGLNLSVTHYNDLWRMATSGLFSVNVRACGLHACARSHTVRSTAIIIYVIMILLAQL